jgi:hypothetical protein
MTGGLSYRGHWLLQEENATRLLLGESVMEDFGDHGVFNKHDLDEERK